MASEGKREWQKTDEESVLDAIARLGQPEHEIRRIDAKWVSLRKKVANPATWVGAKY